MAPPTACIYPLSLHDALPISNSSRDATVEVAIERTRGGDWVVPELQQRSRCRCRREARYSCGPSDLGWGSDVQDRKSTRLNSSHVAISYAGFCLNKKMHYSRM